MSSYFPYAASELLNQPSTTTTPEGYHSIDTMASVVTRNSKQVSPQASLLGLPPELRLHIYEALLLLLSYQEPWVVYHIHRHVYNVTMPAYLLDKEKGPGSLGIFRTCNQVYEEASKFLWDSTRVTVCVRPPFAKAWSDSSISLGVTENVRLWSFLKKLNFVVEPEHKIDKNGYLDRLSAFVEAIECGCRLRELVLVLQPPDEHGLPDYIGEIIEVLSGLKVNGTVNVRFCGDIEEKGWDAIRERLLEQIKGYDTVT